MAETTFGPIFIIELTELGLKPFFVDPPDLDETTIINMGARFMTSVLGGGERPPEKLLGPNWDASFEEQDIYTFPFVMAAPSSPDPRERKQGKVMMLNIVCKKKLNDTQQGRLEKSLKDLVSYTRTEIAWRNRAPGLRFQIEDAVTLEVEDILARFYEKHARKGAVKAIVIANEYGEEVYSIIGKEVEIDERQLRRQVSYAIEGFLDQEKSRPHDTMLSMFSMWGGVNEIQLRLSRDYVLLIVSDPVKQRPGALRTEALELKEQLQPFLTHG